MIRNVNWTFVLQDGQMTDFDELLDVVENSEHEWTSIYCPNGWEYDEPPETSYTIVKDVRHSFCKYVVHFTQILYISGNVQKSNQQCFRQFFSECRKRMKDKKLHNK